MIVMGDFCPRIPKKPAKSCLIPISMRRRRPQPCSLQSGPATGWPVCVTCGLTITGIRRTEGLTTIPGWPHGGGAALREAISAAGPVNLEPQNESRNKRPGRISGNAIGLFNQAQGKVEDVADHAGLKILRGSALAPSFRLSHFLRSVTQGGPALR